jgi:hypothetical protein
MAHLVRSGRLVIDFFFAFADFAEKMQKPFLRTDLTYWVYPESDLSHTQKKLIGDRLTLKDAGYPLRYLRLAMIPGVRGLFIL